MLQQAGTKGFTFSIMGACPHLGSSTNVAWGSRFSNSFATAGDVILSSSPFLQALRNLG